MTLAQGVFHAIAVQMLTGTVGSASRVACSSGKSLLALEKSQFSIVLYYIVLLECPHSMVEVGFP